MKVIELTENEALLLGDIITSNISHSPEEMRNGTAYVKEELLYKIHKQLNNEKEVLR